jgi:hypothetical protein
MLTRRNMWCSKGKKIVSVEGVIDEKDYKGYEEMVAFGEDIDRPN